MILIADSGSSKTDWYLIRKDHPGIELQTIGLNPYFVSPDEIEDVLQKELAPFFYFDQVDEIYFYGAGCGLEANRGILSDVLGNNFSRADIEIYPDILGTARALFRNNSGIACILGTGSNSCYYNGKEIENKLPSMGFILGDTGSGVDMGKRLIKAFLSGKLPGGLRDNFDKKYQLSDQHILDAIYRHPRPNAFLAKFAFFIETNKTDPFINEIIITSFQEFIDTEIKMYNNYQDLPVGFGGSIALIFSEILKEVAEKNGISIHQLIKSPIPGLISYHTPAAYKR